MSNSISNFFSGIKQKIIFPLIYTFDSLKTEILSMILYYITIAFYFFIFGPSIQNLQPKKSNTSDYITFFIPGLIILTIIGSVSAQTLKFWINASSYKLMSYWLSLPVSIEYLILLFTFNTVINTFFYSLPLIIILIFLNFNLELILVILSLILTGGIFLYYIYFFMVLYMFNKDYFIIIQQTSQPLLTRISPVFYNLIFIPVLFLPLAYINPFTWIVIGMRDIKIGQYIIIILLFFNLLLFKLVKKYWEYKIKKGSLIS